MNELPPTTITILYDHSTYYLSTSIGGIEYALGTYECASLVGAALTHWLSGRGLTTAPGSGRRLAEAQRLGSCCVTFDVERSVVAHDVSYVPTDDQ